MKGIWKNINKTSSNLCLSFTISTSDIKLIQIRDMPITCEIDSFLSFFFCGFYLLGVSQFRLDAKLGYCVAEKHRSYILCGYQITFSHLLWLLPKSNKYLFTCKPVLCKVVRQLRNGRKLCAMGRVFILN